MTCDDYKDLMPTYLLDDLSVEERDAVRTHLQSGCPRCAGSLAEAEAILARLSLAVSPVDPPAHLRQKLLARVAASSSAAPIPINRPAPSARSGRLVLPWGLGIAASIAAILLGMWGTRQRQTAVAVEQESAGRAEQNVRLKTIVQSQEDRIRRMQSPQVQVASLEGTPAQSRAVGRLFLDRKNHVVDFAVAGLSPPPPGKTYELWVVTADQKKLPVGIFTVNANGEGFLEAPVETTSVVLAAVTDEPGLMAQPTGHFQLTGKVETTR